MKLRVKEKQLQQGQQSSKQERVPKRENSDNQLEIMKLIKTDKPKSSKIRIPKIIKL